MAAEPCRETPQLVLVHGARHGAWCWCPMIERLRAAGHAPLAPTLSGMAERRHQLSPDIDLLTHVLDVTTLLEFFDLRDVVLVGHSYGGMVVTAAADRLPDRVAGVLYLDAVVAGDGQSLLDAIAPERAAGLQAAVRDHGDGWRLPGAPDVARSYGVTDPEDLAWAGPLITDQPFATFTQPLALTGAVDRIPQAYVHFTRADIIPAAAAHAVRDRGALWRELPLMHDAMITHPDAVADCVLELVTELRGDGSA